VDRAADDRHVLLHGDHRGARLHDAGHTGALARPFDEDAEAAAVAHDLAHVPHRLPIRLAAADRERAELTDELPEPRDAMHLGLRDVEGVARVRDREERDVDPREVVERDDDAAFPWDPLLAVGAQPRRARGERAERVPADEPRDVLPLHDRTSASICSTTSSTVLFVVSISFASSAGCMRSAS